MPIYEYDCEKCGKFEEFQNISDKPLKKCPKCGKTVNKVFSTPTVFGRYHGIDERQFHKLEGKDGKQKLVRFYDKEKGEHLRKKK